MEDRDVKKATKIKTAETIIFPDSDIWKREVDSAEKGKGKN
jgi:hypothetical protein